MGLYWINIWKEKNKLAASQLYEGQKFTYILIFCERISLFSLVCDNLSFINILFGETSKHSVDFNRMYNSIFRNYNSNNFIFVLFLRDSNF